MAAPQSPGNPQAGPDDEPLYLSAIDLGGRGVIGYFAVVAVAVLTDIVRGDGVVFRSWSGFALQAFGALVLGTIAARSTLTTWQRAGNRFTPANITSASLFIGAALAVGSLLPKADEAQGRKELVAGRPGWSESAGAVSVRNFDDTDDTNHWTPYTQETASPE